MSRASTTPFTIEIVRSRPEPWPASIPGPWPPTDIIIRPCPSCCYDTSACYGNGIKPETPASADSGRIPSALSRNISAFDADSCAAVIADARPSITTLCDKASVSANGQWNGCCVVFAAVHPRRKNSRIVYARGELIRPNENQRGRPGIAEIQRTVALFLFAFRVNRQVFNRQRRNERVANLHPEVIAVRRSAERITPAVFIVRRCSLKV